MRNKKWLFIALAVFLAIFLALIAIPYFFMDQINEKIKTEINKRLNATVNYRDFDLSLIRSFPHFSFYLNDLTIVGKEMFSKDTLLSLSQFSITLDLMSVFKGQQLEIIAVHLKNPAIKLKVLKDGKANWDIVKPDSVLVEEKQDTSKGIALNLKRYSIQNGNILYQDKQTPMFCEIKQLNHEGSGNLMDDIIQLSTQTQIQSLTLRYAGTEYLRNKTLSADIDLEIDNPNFRYTFRKNSLYINDLGLTFDGYVKLNDNSTELNLQYQTLKTDFKSILSLVPGIYTSSFQNIETDGKLALSGYVKGTYQENQYPAFGLNLNIENGKFQYPDLPMPAQNIFVNLKVDNSTGNLEDTRVELNPFKADLAGNPVHITWQSQGLSTMNIRSNIKARIDLSKVSQFYPIEKTTLKGSFACNAKIEGVYSKTSFPQTEAELSLKYGYLKSADFPAAIENLNFEATATNPTGKYQDTKIRVSNFHAELDKQPLDGHFSLENLDNPHFAADLTGKLDLEKLLKIYPIEGMKLTGTLDIQNLQTQGTQADVLAGRYDKVPTSGKVLIQQFTYQTPDLPKIEIQTATLNFNPKEIAIPNYQGKLGSSPVSLQGKLSNYLLYVLKNEQIEGNFTFESPKFNVNEWLAEPQTPEQQTTDTTSALEPIPIPQNVNFTLLASIQELLYDTYQIKNFKGKVTIKDQILSIEKADFDLLGGKFQSSMSYNTQNIQKPEVKMDLAFREIKIADAFKAFTVVQKFVPIAQKVEGLMNAKFQYRSFLKQDMMPDLTTVNCQGLSELLDARAQDLDVLTQLAQHTSLKLPNQLRIQNQKVQFKIENGRLYVQPFDIKWAENQINVSGSNGLDQSLDYLLKMTVPTGKVGQMAVQQLNKWANTALSTPQTLKVDFKVSGTISKPVVTPVGASTDTNPAQNLKEEGKQQLEKMKEQAQDKAKEEAERLKQEAEKKAKEEAERLKQEAERKKAEAEKKAKEEAERLRQEAERKKAEAEKKAKEEAERLKREAEEKAKQKLKNILR